MNRIILFGNGFDLAHNLPTSFSDFLEYFWKNVISDFEDLKTNEFIEKYEKIGVELSGNSKNIKTKNYKGLLNAYNNKYIQLNIFNDFLSYISDTCENKKWVDIENEYYDLLKKSYDFSDNKTYLMKYGRKIKKEKIDRLNEEFNVIRESVIKYISEVEKDYVDKKIIKKDILHKIFSDFNVQDFSEEGINKILNIEIDKYQFIKKEIEINQKGIEFFNETQLRLYNRLKQNSNPKTIRALLTSDISINYFNLRPNNFLFLNFNYTNTPYHYLNGKLDYFYHPTTYILRNSVKFINIHGSINNPIGEPIVFGYGDEVDDSYREIENLNDDRYLKNIKSIKYLDVPSYKKLLEYIESDYYQIFIMGHSCGNSDRTLLNTLFEHKNCISIKPFYYQKKDGTDNYSELIMNITRNFKDKASLRDKVVNKVYTEKLTNE